ACARRRRPPRGRGALRRRIPSPPPGRAGDRFPRASWRPAPRAAERVGLALPAPHAADGAAVAQAADDPGGARQPTRRRHPLSQHLAIRSTCSRYDVARRALGQAVHDPRALADLPHTRPLEVQRARLREAGVLTVHLARAEAAPALALHRHVAADRPPRRPVRVAEPIHGRDARQAWFPLPSRTAALLQRPRRRGMADTRTAPATPP